MTHNIDDTFMTSYRYAENLHALGFHNVLEIQSKGSMSVSNGNLIIELSMAFTMVEEKPRKISKS